MKSYNVLWIDDEPEKNDAFPEQAMFEGINLVHFKTNKAGIDDLYENPNKYDAIILDAKGFEDSEDERAGFAGLHNSIGAINALHIKIPYFIYSGFLEKDEYTQIREMLKNVEIFTKGEDSNLLFSRIKEEADKQLDTQIRHENNKLFNALESYSAENNKTILEILQAIKTGKQDLSDHLYFTPIRTILESLFRKANKVGILHDACVNIKGSQVNLTESSKFLAGEDCVHLKVRCTKTHFPKLIADAVKNILFITGAASHTSEVDVTKNIDVQQYRKEINTPYLLFNLLYQLSDVLIWFHQYSLKNLDIQKNKEYWEDIEFFEENRYGKTIYYKWETAEVTNIAPNGWATLTLSKPVENKLYQVSVFKDVVSEKRLALGEKVKVVLDSSNPKSKEIEKK
jgi:hypothetical protein